MALPSATLYLPLPSLWPPLTSLLLLFASLWPPFGLPSPPFSTPFLLLFYSFPTPFYSLGGRGVWDLEMFVILAYKGTAPRGAFMGHNDGNFRHSRL